MYQLIPIALFGFFPVAILLFSKMVPRRAMIVGVIGATMFLPMGTVELPLIAGRKDTLCNLALFIAVLIMDPSRIMAFRARWMDFPIILLCLGPFASAMLNGLPPYNAFAASLATFLSWGVPYILGRIYLGDLRSFWQMAWGIFIGGLIYAPGCIFEMAFSPISHQLVYGVPAFEDFQQSIRLGGYRPVMFMQHGLMVSTFMCAASTIGIWLWWNKASKPIFRLPAWLPILFVTLVALACKSAGALMLMAVAFAVLILSRLTGKSIFVYILIFVAPIYILARTVGGWTGDNAVIMATQYIDLDHGGSLQVRFQNENVLVERGMVKPMFGWGPNGDFLLKVDFGRITSIPDGLWVIAFGSSGLVGLAALFGMLLVPVFMFVRRFPVRTWSHPAMAAPAVLAVFIPTFAIDCLMNAMINPAWIVALGGLGTLSVVRDPFPRHIAKPKQKITIQVREPAAA